MLPGIRGLIAFLFMGFSISAELIVTRIDVEPGGGSTNERPQARVAGQRPDAGCFASSGNRGDWNIAAGVSAAAPKGRTLLLSDGVAIPSLNELLPRPQRGVVGVGAKLTTNTQGSFNGGFWVAGFTAEGNGAEANYDFAVAFFPFVDGWMGGTVANDGTQLLAGANLPEGTEIRRFSGGTFDGEIRITIPGTDSIEDAMLFTTAAGNGDDVTAVGPLADGSGWHVRVADESHNYRSEQAVPFSFVIIPYDCPNLVAGRLRRDGTAARGVGGFHVTRTATGRYELHIPGKTDADGILLLTVTLLNKDGVEDNAMAWAYDPDACGGSGGFVIESYDQPSFDSQDVEFCFAFIEYAGTLDPRRRPTGSFQARETWADSVLAGLAAQAEAESRTPPQEPWTRQPMAPGTDPARIAIALEDRPDLWLMTFNEGDPKDLSALWAEVTFVMPDGTRHPLETAALRYAHGQLENAADTAPLEGIDARRVVRVAPSSALLCTVPEGATKLEARIAVTGGANATGAVRFRVAALPYQRSFWQEHAWPVLKTTFPVEAQRLARDLTGSNRLQTLDPETCRDKLTAGLDRMIATFGPLTSRLPPPGQGSLSELLRRHGAAARLVQTMAAACEELWRQAPTLARFVDYPNPTLGALREEILQAALTRPALNEQAERSLAVLTDCERTAASLVADLIDGKALDGIRKDHLETTVAEVAEWTDRILGWTTYGGDNHRSWVSHEPLQLPLRPLWTYTPAHPPAPAWPPPRTDNPAVNHQLSPTLTYDRAFHPVAADDRLVFGSSSADAVICLDAATGRERWRFVTGGPVRIAPAIAGGRVYAGSDDGRLYCLDLDTGSIHWAYSLAESTDRQLAGNQRIISQWAVRCGICVDGDTVYAAGGIFPKLGTVLFALDSASGVERWRRPLSWTPQGFMLLSPERLFVPTGRTPFRSFDRADGTPITAFGRSNSWGMDLPGGTLALVVNERLFTGPDEGGEFHLYDTENAECLVRARGLRVIVDGRMTFILRHGAVLAQDRNPFVRHGAIRKLWETPVETAYCMLKAGDHLLLGGNGTIQILDSRNGAVKATVPVGQSRVEGLVWTNGRLTASLADGTLVCLAAGAPPDQPPRVAKPPVSRPARHAEAEARARDLHRWCGFRRGYALVAGDIDLAAALAAAGDMNVVLVHPDRDVVTTWRNRLAASCIPGSELTVHHQPPGGLPYRPFLFNLVVLPDGPGRTPETEWLRVLRPYGGALVSSTPARFAESAAAVQARAEDAPPAGWAAAWRRGAPPGAGQWTHGYADAANTACSVDDLPPGEFAVLWFGRPGPRHMFERHVKAAPPLFLNGTVTITGKDYLAAVDAYNGALLWERHLDASGRMAMLKDCGNMVLAEDGLHVAVKDECIALDARSGRELRRYALEAGAPGAARWGYVAAANNLLLGSATKADAVFRPGNKPDYQAVWYHFQPVITSTCLFALQRPSGVLSWRFEPSAGVLLNPTITVLDGLVVFVESTNPATRADEDGKIPLAELFSGGPRLTALHLDSGKIAWRERIDLNDFHHAIYMSGANGVLVLSGSRHDEVDGRKLIQYQLVGIDAKTGRELWRNDNTPTRAHILDGGHGEQTQHPAIVGNTVYGPGFARNLLTGEPHGGWLWQKSPQCATLSTSRLCAFSRQNGNPTVAALASGDQKPLTQVTRPGCWINTLPAGGIVVIPEASSGCTCGYSVQTSLALYPLPQAGR